MPGPHRDSTFRTYELRPGRVPSLPRGRRCSHGRSRVSGRRLPHPSGNVPAPRPNIHHPGLNLTRNHRGFTAFTRPVFPWPVVPGWNGHPWASPRSSAPRRYQRRTSGRGQALSTGLGLRSRHHRSTLLPTSPLVSCDLVSHLVRVAYARVTTHSGYPSDSQCRCEVRFGSEFFRAPEQSAELGDGQFPRTEP